MLGSLAERGGVSFQTEHGEDEGDRGRVERRQGKW